MFPQLSQLYIIQNTHWFQVYIDMCSGST